MDKFYAALKTAIKNFIPKEGYELSKKIHQAEELGYELSRKENRLWEELTIKLLESENV